MNRLPGNSQSGEVLPSGDPAHETAAQAMTLPEDLCHVGKVLDAWGVRGWIKIAPDDPEAAALLNSKVWWLSRPGPRVVPVAVNVRLARRQGSTIVALLEGASDRTLAEQYRGSEIAVRRADFPPAGKDEFYWADLIGCAVTNPQGESLGTVVGLLDSAAHAILRVQPATSGDAKPIERLIPFVDAYVQTVDLASRSIVALWDASYD
jgi:16S rRNA processing protein RimM